MPWALMPPGDEGLALDETMGVALSTVVAAVGWLDPQPVMATTGITSAAAARAVFRVIAGFDAAQWLAVPHLRVFPVFRARPPPGNPARQGV
jgi:hypothetical protein